MVSLLKNRFNENPYPIFGAGPTLNTENSRCQLLQKVFNEKTSPEKLEKILSLIYKNRTFSTEEIVPYNSSITIPGFELFSLNIGQIRKNFKKSSKIGDSEGIKTLLIEFLNLPLKIITSIGSLLEGGASWHLLSTKGLGFLRFNPLVEALSCIFEGIASAIGLHRQITFNQKFDFLILSNLNTFLNSDDMHKSKAAFIQLARHLNIDYPPELQKEDAIAYRKYCDAIQEYRSDLQKKGLLLLAKNVDRLRENYLEVSKEDLSKICKKVKHHFSDKTVSSHEQIKVLGNTILKKMAVNQTKLARRTSLGMVKHIKNEVSRLTQNLERGRLHHILREGLKLFEMIETEALKKKLIHILGLIVVSLTIASLIITFIGCCALVPYILLGVSILFIGFQAMIEKNLLFNDQKEPLSIDHND